MPTQQEWSTGFEDVPAGMDAGSTLDTVIQNYKITVRKHLIQGGHLNTSLHSSVGLDLAKDGLHMVDGDDEGGGGSGEFNIYKSDGSTKLVTITDTNLNMVSGTITGTNVSAGANPGHSHDSTITIPLATPATGTGICQGTLFYNRGNGTLTILEAELLCFDEPSGGSVIVDVEKITIATTTDTNAATHTDAVVGLTITDGNWASGVDTGPFANDQLGVGGAWRFNITTNNNADNLLVALKVRRP